MIESLNDELIGTRKSIRQVCEDLGIEVPAYVTLEQCSHCNLWAKRLKRDLDDFPICDVCLTFYGE